MRKQIAAILRRQSEVYLKRYKPTVVVVAGSVGKTSTTQAIATILESNFRVRKTLKNYNTDLGVPLSIFGYELPSNLMNPFAWAWIIMKSFFSSMQKPNFDVLVLELGTDKIGEIAEFSWLKPDIAVVTAVAAEHMEYFQTLDAVAEEELVVSKYSQKTFINKEMVAPEYIKFADTEELFNYSRSDIEHVGLKESDLNVNGSHSVDAVAAGLAVGKDLGMSVEQLKASALRVLPQFGRMMKLNGVSDSVLIDDTYNSSPEAVIAAIKYIEEFEAPQRILLLGNMNELGATSEIEHIKIGEYCNPKKIDLVVTLGPDANKFTADSAEKKGCKVIRTKTPYQAAEEIKSNLESGAVVLLKGSQNGVFAEEAVKLLLDNPEDSSKLVRQSNFWQKKKRESFEVEVNK